MQILGGMKGPDLSFGKVTVTLLRDKRMEKRPGPGEAGQEVLRARLGKGGWGPWGNECKGHHGNGAMIRRNWMKRAKGVGR